MSIDLPTPRRVLTIGAHPDDAEFGAGGTLAKWAADGAEVTMLVVTDGSKGTWDPEMPPGELVNRRLFEQRRAADTLGAAHVINLGEVDGELEYTMQLRETLCGHIRSARPDVVLTHDPWRRYMLHPDHRATGWGAIDGVVAARDHLFFPDHLTELSHHRPGSLLLWAADEPNHLENVEDHLDTKVAALLAHATQAPTTMDDAGIDDAATESFRTEIFGRAATVGSTAGLGAAEAFRRIEP